MDEDVQKALKQILVMCKMPTEAKWRSQYCSCSWFAKKHWSKEIHLRTKAQDPSIRMTHVVKHCNWNRHWLSPDILETYSEQEDHWCAHSVLAHAVPDKNTIYSQWFSEIYFENSLYFCILSKNLISIWSCCKVIIFLSVCIEVKCKNKAQCSSMFACRAVHHSAPFTIIFSFFFSCRMWTFSNCCSIYVLWKWSGSVLLDIVTLFSSFSEFSTFSEYVLYKMSIRQMHILQSVVSLSLITVFTCHFQDTWWAVSMCLCSFVRPW